MREQAEPKLPTNRSIHYSFLLHIFILLNLFNLFNCRALCSSNSKDLNIFAGLHRHSSFIMITVVIILIQYSLLFNKSAGLIFGTSAISFEMHLVALGLGLGSIVIASAVKLTPRRLTVIFNRVCGVEEGIIIDSSLNHKKNIE